MNEIQLPAGWENPKLNETAQINPSLGRSIAHDSIQVTFVPMRAVDEEGGGLVRPEVRTYGEVKKGYTSFLSGDVIMAKITPCMENGKTTVVPDFPGGVCFGSTEFHVLRPENGVLGRWLSQFLLQHDVRHAAQRSMAGGVGQMRVPAAFLQDIRIPLSPAQEQSRIADALDELFSDLDAGVAALERVREKLKLYRVSVLKAAVEGALTAEWRAQHPHTEPASELLQRILAERRRRWEEHQLAKFKAKGQEPPKDWKAKYKEPVGPDTSDLPPLPEGWGWSSLDALIVNGPQNGLYLPSDLYGSGLPILRIDDFQNGWVRLRDELKRVRADNDDAETYALRQRDLVVNRVNSMTHLGKCLVVSAQLDGALFESNMMRAKIAEAVCAIFVEFYLRSESGRRRLTKDAKWAVNQASINQQDVTRTAISLPPFAEQEAIVEAVEDQLSVIDHLESDLDAKQKMAQGLRQAILRHAFTGQLVRQDPNDEPASELLKRIAAEREARAQVAVKTKRSMKRTMEKH